MGSGWVKDNRIVRMGDCYEVRARLGRCMLYSLL